MLPNGPSGNNGNYDAYNDIFHNGNNGYNGDKDADHGKNDAPSWFTDGWKQWGRQSLNGARRDIRKMSCLAKWLERHDFQGENPGEKSFNEVVGGLYKDENSPLRQEHFCEGDPVIEALVEKYGAGQNARELKHNFDCSFAAFLPLAGDSTAVGMLQE
jgi:hypothetical protein